MMNWSVDPQTSGNDNADIRSIVAQLLHGKSKFPLLTQGLPDWAVRAAPARFGLESLNLIVGPWSPQQAVRRGETLFSSADVVHRSRACHPESRRSKYPAASEGSTGDIAAGHLSSTTYRRVVSFKRPVPDTAVRNTQGLALADIHTLGTRYTERGSSSKVLLRGFAPGHHPVEADFKDHQGVGLVFQRRLTD